jgi:hypothetical protein
MELTYVTIVVLACMIFVLAGMMGYLYWQQTRMLQHLQSLAMAFATHLQPPEQLLQPDEPAVESEEEDDDRLPVKEEEVEHVQGPPEEKTPTATSASEDDVDDLQDKTAAELRDLLTKKGIPFGKRDSKSILLQLLKATSA